jgi:hypothetical protein
MWNVAAIALSPKQSCTNERAAGSLFASGVEISQGPHPFLPWIGKGA